MDAPDPDKTGFVVQTWHWAVTGCVGVLTWLGKSTISRIQKLEESRLTRDEFKVHTEAMAKASTEAAEDLSKARHDLRNDLQRIVNAIELDRANLRQDMKQIFDQQRVMGEDIAEIKGKMK